MKHTAAATARVAAAAGLLALAMGACEGRRTLTLFPGALGGPDAGENDGGTDDEPPFFRCDEDRDCPDTLPSCDDREDRCVECGPAVPCKYGFVCYQEERRCEPVCNGVEDCGGERPHCNTASGLCVECLDHLDCPEWEPRCESRTGRCGDCAADSDCGTRYCRPQDLECVDCIVDSDCEGEGECRRGQCQR